MGRLYFTKAMQFYCSTGEALLTDETLVQQEGVGNMRLSKPQSPMALIHSLTVAFSASFMARLYGSLPPTHTLI